MSEEERIKLLSKCKDIDCICQDCLYLEFVKNNILNPIQEENQELKDSINALQKELNEENFQCSKYAIENQLLKKQLEELKSTNKVLSEKLTKDKILKQDCLTTCYGIPIGDIPKLINQQKKFIEYLENEINKIQEQIKNYDIWHEVGTDINFLILKKQFNIEILSKYKKIIGDDK